MTVSYRFFFFKCMEIIVFCTPLPHNPEFLTTLKKTDLLKTMWKKEKMLVTIIFSFFPTMFSSLSNTNLKLLSPIYIVDWKCFQCGHG